MESNDLRDVSTHFEFGENWADFAQNVGEARIGEAEKSLLKLVDKETLSGSTFLDIGCGSGLFSLAALRLGAKKVDAVDIDKNSVQTTRELLRQHAPTDSNFSCQVTSVFDLDPNTHGNYDIVYSWGVLHHTGDMYAAIRQAAELVRPSGSFVIALYKKTPCCGLWARIKKMYCAAPRLIQKCLRAAYMSIFLLRKASLGVNPIRFCREYKLQRGMSFRHDAHDWLGGYPYESISPEAFHALAKSLNFTLEKEFIQPPTRGILCSGCDEYVIRKNG